MILATGTSRAAPRTTAPRTTAPRFSAACFLTGGFILLSACGGCIVPQPRGNGKLTREIEPRTQRGFWQYLPEPYVRADDAARKSRRWPLVVTFHGMKPFDNARPQALEMEQEADRYGYIVIAPELAAPDVLMQFPVRTIQPAFKSDEQATLSILDHVFANTDADPSNVLATSWSSGGYMAHYMVNRHPSRFTCLAVRQSNFSSTILDPARTPYSKYHPILIVNTQKDFGICLQESTEAIKWYESYGYTNVWWVRIKNLGHERTPDMAADFFGRIAGVTPSRPSAALAQRVVIDGNPEGIAMLAGKLPEFQRPPDETATDARLARGPTPARQTLFAATPMLNASTAGNASTTGGGTPESRLASRPPSGRPPGPRQPAPPTSPTPLRVAAGTPGGDSQPRMSVRVSSKSGIDPLYVGFSVDCPSDWLTTAQFVWKLDGAEIGRGANGSKTLTTPGLYDLAVEVTTRDGATYSANRSLRVFPRLSRKDSETSESRNAASESRP